jgi:hypothetical protein
MRRSLLLLLLTYLTAAATGRGQAPIYSAQARTYANATTDNSVYQWQVTGGLYLGGNHIRQMARDPNGTLWLADGEYQGPTAGLLRVAPDGTVTRLNRGQNNVPTLRPTAIAAHNGLLWMLTTEGNFGPTRLHKYDGRAWTSQVVAPALLSDAEPRSLILKADPTGTLWLFTERAILKLNAEATAATATYSYPPGNGSVVDVAFSAAGLPHLLRYYGGGFNEPEAVSVARLAGSQFEVLPLRTESAFSGKRDPVGMTLDGAGIWVAFGQHGASRYTANAWTNLAAGSFLAQKNVRGMGIDAQGNTFFSVADEGLLKRSAQGQLTSIRNVDVEAGILWVDGAGSIWTYGRNSLAKLTENPITPAMSFSYTDGGISQPTTFTTLTTEAYTERTWYMGDHTLLDIDDYQYETLPQLSNSRLIQYQYQKPGTYRVRLVAQNTLTGLETHISRPITITDRRAATLLAEWPSLDSLTQAGYDELLVPGYIASGPGGRLLVSLDPAAQGLGQRTSGGGAAWLNGSRWEGIPEITAYNARNPRQPLGPVFRAVISPTDGAVWLLPRTNRFNYAQTVFRLLNGTLTAYPTNDPSGIISQRILDLFITKDGTVWAIGMPGRLTSLDNGSASLARFDGARWTSFFLDGITNQFLTYRAGAVDADGRIWLASSNGLIGFDGKTATTLTAARLATDTDRHWLAIDKKNRKWMLSDASTSLLRVEGTTVTTLRLPTLPNPVAEVQGYNNIGFTPTSLLIDQNDVVWVGTTWGLLAYNGTAWRVFQTANSGMPANNITGLGLSATNQLWVGSSNHNDAFYNGYGFLSRFTGASRVANSLAFNITTATVPTSATAFSTTLTATQSWTIASDAPWLTSSPLSGSGNAALTIQAQANPTFADRTGKLTATDATGQKAELSLTQRAATPTATGTFGLSAPVPGNGATYPASITANTTWTLSSTANWITFSLGSGGAGVTALTITVGQNPSQTTERSGQLRLTPGNGGTVQTVAVSQARLIILATDPGVAGTLLAYPNPFGEQLTVQFGPGVVFPAQVRLLDTQGRVRWQRDVAQPTQQAIFQVGTLPSGTYWLHVVGTPAGHATQLLHH